MYRCLNEPYKADIGSYDNTSVSARKYKVITAWRLVSIQIVFSLLYRKIFTDDSVCGRTVCWFVWSNHREQ